MLTHCEVCEASIASAELLFKKEDIRKIFTEDPFWLKRCPFCGLVFVSNPPPLETIKSIYSASYYDSGQQFNGLRRSSAVRKNSLFRLKRLQTYRKGGRLLDIGCGTGIFLDAAKEAYDVTGMEISAHAVTAARGKFCLSLHQGDLVDVGSSTLSGQHFDVITLWDVIGHLLKPRLCLKQVYSLLRPGGIMALSTGDIDSMMARVLRRKWHLATPPEILFFFSRRSIGIFLERIGFEVIHIEKSGKYVSLAFIARKLRRLYGWAWPKRILLHLPWREVYINLFDIMTVYARRPNNS